MAKRCKTYNFNWLKGSKIIFVSVAFLFLVVSYGEGTSDSSPLTKEKGSSAAGKKTEEAQASEKAEKGRIGKREVEYTYDPTGKSDPFKSFIQSPTGKEQKGPKSPLQEYDLSQLRLVAIVMGPESNIALAEDAAGKGYFLRKGTVIGKNNGRVKEILKDGMIIEEVYVDVSGQERVSEVSLFLHRSEKEE